MTDEEEDVELLDAAEDVSVEVPSPLGQNAMAAITMATTPIPAPIHGSRLFVPGSPASEAGWGGSIGGRVGTPSGVTPAPHIPQNVSDGPTGWPLGQVAAGGAGGVVVAVIAAPHVAQNPWSASAG